MRDPDIIHSFAERKHAQYSFASNVEEIPKHVRKAWQLEIPPQLANKGWISYWLLECPFVDVTHNKWVLSVSIGAGRPGIYLFMLLEVTPTCAPDPSDVSSIQIVPMATVLHEFHARSEEEAQHVGRVCARHCTLGEISPNSPGEEWRHYVAAAIESYRKLPQTAESAAT